MLEELTSLYPAPACIRSDNGPDDISQALRGWCGASGTTTAYTEPGSPWENGFAESFNGRFRHEFLNTELFATLAEAQSLADRWRWECITLSPHSALQGLTALEAAQAACSDSHRSGPMKGVTSAGPEISSRSGIPDARALGAWQPLSTQHPQPLRTGGGVLGAGGGRPGGRRFPTAIAEPPGGDYAATPPRDTCRRDRHRPLMRADRRPGRPDPPDRQRPGHSGRRHRGRPAAGWPPARC